MAYFLGFDALNETYVSNQKVELNGHFRIDVDMRIKSFPPLQKLFDGNGAINNQRLDITIRETGADSRTYCHFLVDGSPAGDLSGILGQRVIFGLERNATDSDQSLKEFSFIGCRFNQQAGQFLDAEVYGIKVYDSSGILIHNFNKQALNGANDTVYPETVGGNDGTLVNFPTDDSQWVFYDDGSSPEPVAQPVSLITAEIKNEALTLPISEALSVNLLTGEHVTNGYVLNLISSQVGNATISEERHQASMLTVEQTASQSVISIAAEHLSEAQILTPIQHQRLNSIVAQQVEQALSASLASIQALTFVVAEERQNAAPLTVEQYTGQLITLIVAEQRAGAQTLLVSQVNKLDLVTAEQASDAQALSIKDLQKIKTIEVEQLTETEILHVLLSGDNTDLTGLRLQPVTPIYSITPIANSYSLNKV